MQIHSATIDPPDDGSCETCANCMPRAHEWGDHREVEIDGFLVVACKFCDCKEFYDGRDGKHVFI